MDLAARRRAAPPPTRPDPESSLRHHPALSTTATIELTSTAFTHGGLIGRRHSGPGRGPNVSPELHWGPVPAGTAELLLVLEDVDVPAAEPGYQLAVLLPPDLPGIPEGMLTADPPACAGSPCGKAAPGTTDRAPSLGHGDHRYGFHLVALDSPVPDEVISAAVTEAGRAAGSPVAACPREPVRMVGWIAPRTTTSPRRRARRPPAPRPVP